MKVILNLPKLTKIEKNGGYNLCGIMIETKDSFYPRHLSVPKE